jgi:putative peptide zinc metalloprotease protein
MAVPDFKLHLMNYKNIQIHKTEFNDDYLLLYNNRTLMVGFLVKEILELLQNDVSSHNDINEEMNLKYNIDIDENAISSIKERLDNFLNQKSKDNFIRLFRILNPDKLNLHFLDFLFFKNIFYILFFITFIINLYFIIALDKAPLYNTKEIIIWIFSIFFILFMHEIGHFISAKKYGVASKNIGFGIYLIFPVLYINLGESWRLQKSKRIMINLAGIYFQLIIGTMLIIMYFFFDNHIILYLFFTNFIIVLINMNPLIRFDGYWVLSDVMNVKNLSKKSTETLKSIVKMDFYKNSFWMNTYSVFKLFFLLFIFLHIVIMISKIAVKLFNNYPLSMYDYLFSLIIITLIIKKIKK